MMFNNKPLTIQGPTLHERTRATRSVATETPRVINCAEIRRILHIITYTHTHTCKRVVRDRDRDTFSGFSVCCRRCRAVVTAPHSWPHMMAVIMAYVCVCSDWPCSVITADRAPD